MCSRLSPRSWKLRKFVFGHPSARRGMPRESWKEASHSQSGLSKMGGTGITSCCSERQRSSITLRHTGPLYWTTHLVPPKTIVWTLASHQPAVRRMLSPAQSRTSTSLGISALPSCCQVSRAWQVGNSLRSSSAWAVGHFPSMTARGRGFSPRVFIDTAASYRSC